MALTAEERRELYVEVQVPLVQATEELLKAEQAVDTAKAEAMRVATEILLDDECQDLDYAYSASVEAQDRAGLPEDALVREHSKALFEALKMVRDKINQAHVAAMNAEDQFVL